VSSDVVEHLETHADAIATEVTRKMEEEVPDLFERYEKSPRSSRDPRVACKEDTIHHLKSLSSALEIGDADEFSAYRSWLIGLLVPRGIPEADVDLNFRVIADVLRSRVGDEAAEEATAMLLRRGDQA
jgi:hypothetical protein